MATLSFALILAFTFFSRFACIYSDFRCNSNTESSLGFEMSLFVPYTKPFGTEEIPMVKVTVAGVEIEMPMDTGSTGILIGAPLLPNIDSSAGTKAYQYFSSSYILYNGRLVNLPIKFYGSGNNSLAVATVPVLIVDWSVKCPWYNPLVDTFDCPPNPNEPKPPLRDVSKITYMGVGFGRNRRGKEQPNSLPSANPFLNIEAIDGAPVRKDYRVGYTISTKGVYLGLTEENTKGFVWTNLEPGLTHANDYRDWAMMNTCFRVNNGPNSCGYGLIDTGITQMYLKPVEGVEIPNKTIPNPDKESNVKYVKRVDVDTEVVIGFPDLGEKALATYSFKVGSGATMAPKHVVPVKQNATAYVNTGRNFLFGYSVAFDAVRGRFGFRRV